MENLTADQTKFFYQLISGKREFLKKYKNRTKEIGCDGAFYYTLGEFQTIFQNDSYDSLTEDQKDEFDEAIWNEFGIEW